MTAAIVITTVDAKFDAGALANELVDRHLAACVNIIPQIRSIYRWQDGIEDDAEQLLLIKTTFERLNELRAALFEKHPYDTPEFVVMQPDQIADAYREWLIDAVRK